jgi:hypothetical protein
MRRSLPVKATTTEQELSKEGKNKNRPRNE